jgi:glycosyltransferase involved in cell wall biosynthesis
MARYAIITTCKGRLAHLRESLPTFCAFPDAEVVVVDYGCPENAGQWVKDHLPGVTVVRVDEPGEFNVCRARNAGAAASQADVLFFVDADVKLDPAGAPEIGERILPGTYGVVGLDAEDLQDLGGSCLVHRGDFDRAGGYDEVLRGYAMEDVDLYDRLEYLGVKSTTVSRRWFSAIPHSNELRMQFRSGRKNETQLVGLVYRKFLGAMRRLQRTAMIDVGTRELVYKQSQTLVRQLLASPNPAGGLQIGLAIPVADQAEEIGAGVSFEINLALKMKPKDPVRFLHRYGSGKSLLMR